MRQRHNVTVLTRNRAAASATVRNVACVFGANAAAAFAPKLDPLRRTRTRSGFTVSHHLAKRRWLDSRLRSGRKDRLSNQPKHKFWMIFVVLQSFRAQKLRRSNLREQPALLGARRTIRTILPFFRNLSDGLSPNRIRTRSARPWILEPSATGLCEPDLHVFAKLFEDRLERGLEAQALSGREIGGDDDVLNFFVGHLVDVDLARQPAA